MDAVAFLRAVCGQEELPTINALIATAREMVEDFTGRALTSSGWLMASDGWCGRTITLDRSPLSAVAAVKYWPADGGDQVTIAPDDYDVITATVPGRVQLLVDPPAIAARADAVTVEFTAGLPVGEIPATLVHCVRLLVTHLYDNRGAIGDKTTELPWSLRHLMESQRIGGWVA